MATSKEGKALLARMDALLKYLDNVPTFGQTGELKIDANGNLTQCAGAKPAAKAAKKKSAAAAPQPKKPAAAKKQQQPKKQQQTPPKKKQEQPKKKQESPKKKQESPKKQQQQQKGKKQKQKGKQKQMAPAASNLDDVSLCDKFEFRVGRVLEVGDHPNADTIYVEKIDFGEAEPRQVLSGLKKHVTPEEFNNSLVIGFTNLKPGNIRKVKSFAMVMCAKSEDGSTVELMRPPAGAQVGERLYLEGQDPTAQGQGDKNMNIRKKNSPWGAFSAGLKTTAGKEMAFNGRCFVTSAGKVVSSTLPNAMIS